MMRLVSVLLSIWSFVLLGQEMPPEREEESPLVLYDEEGNVLELEPLKLPDRTAADWEAMKNGSLLPGSSLIGGLAMEQLFSTTDERIIIDEEVIQILKEEVKDDRWPIEIDEELTSTYFETPASNFLIDPQHLVTEREREEREGFLSEHAKESVIDLYVYLFEGKQDIPSKESPHSVLRNFFSEKGDVAVVFYHQGRPDRVQMAYSTRIHRGISTKERQEAIRLAKEAAGEKSEASSQLESFLIEMSGRLYAMEKKLPSAALTAETLAELKASQNADKPTLFEKIPESVKTLFATVSLVALVIGVGFLCRHFIEKGRVYEFPEAEGSLILEAPHAAGVGGVLSYANAAQPPSLQKTKADDYLQGL